ncbi:c-type cytochrome [Paracidobacterium acidisoli]|nr:cytochrome c [Paracidobacterium acidisoli]MBT9330781.1 cytochrome c [Paracidobacterium acidisoli]
MAVCIGFIVCGVAQPIYLVHAAQAAGGASTQDGVYTSEQADQGKALYTAKMCSTCHGATLGGFGQNPPLAGNDFLNNWSDQTVGDLFSKIQTTMPATAPGSLKPEETAQIVAYILSANKFPAGKTELPQDTAKLKTIHITKPQP